MEISPIPGIRTIVAVKPRPVDPQLTALFDIESTARPGDDTYTGNGKKAAGAEENDEVDSEDLEEISEGELSGNTDREHSEGEISFFA